MYVYVYDKKTHKKLYYIKRVAMVRQTEQFYIINTDSDEFAFNKATHKIMVYGL